MEIRELEILIRPTKNHQKTRFWALAALCSDDPTAPKDVSPFGNFRGMITVYGVVDGAMCHSVNRYWGSWKHRRRVKWKKMDLGYVHASAAELSQLQIQTRIESHLTWLVLTGEL